jgi:hypothetical protein
MPEMEDFVEKRKRIIEQLKWGVLSLDMVPTHLITKDMVLVAVRQDGRNIRFVPEQFKDKQVLEAMKETVGGTKRRKRKRRTKKLK